MSDHAKRTLKKCFTSTYAHVRTHTHAHTKITTHRQCLNRNHAIIITHHTHTYSPHTPAYIHIPTHTRTHKHTPTHAISSVNVYIWNENGTLTEMPHHSKVFSTPPIHNSNKKYHCGIHSIARKQKVNTPIFQEVFPNNACYGHFPRPSKREEPRGSKSNNSA